MIGRRRCFARLAVATSVVLAASACQQVAGSARPNPAAVAAVQAFPSAATRTDSSPGGSGSTGASPSTTAPTATQTLSTIEDHSTSEPPPGSPGPTPTPSRPTVVLADDGFAVSVMVTTIWARALAWMGARVGIRTIIGPVRQMSALQSGQVDLVQQYNSALLGYLDHDSDAVGRSAVDAAVADSLPKGLTVLKSTPAEDDVLLTVSTGTAARYRLHSISDLSPHLSEVTLLLPDDSSAKSFTRGLLNYYGLTFTRTKTTDFAGPRTIAAIASTASAGLMDASQYQIDDNRFVTLTDPEHLFLTENFIPLVGGAAITPAMKATLNAVSAKLSVSALRILRKKVATGQGSYQDVADAWLASVGLK